MSALRNRIKAPDILWPALVLAVGVGLSFVLGGIVQKSIKSRRWIGRAI